jgi:hypothetical protein
LLTAPISAQDITAAFFSAPTLYSGGVVNARFFRQNTVGLPYQLSYAVISTRVVANVTMSEDYTQPFGQNSATFLTPPLPPGNYTFEVVERGARVQERRSARLAFTVPAPDVPPVSVTVLYERQLKKYFMTAKQDEVTLLLGLNNTANTNWIVVDDNIRVWTTPQAFTLPVCRLFFPGLSRHFFRRTLCEIAGHCRRSLAS